MAVSAISKIMFRNDLFYKRLIPASRLFSTSMVDYLKQITVYEKDDVTVIEGSYISSDRTKHLFKEIKEETKKVCPLCKLNLKVDYTDVLILSQFITSDSKVISRNVTGLCTKQHRRMEYLVERAQKAGLLKKSKPLHPIVDRAQVFLSETRFKQYFVENYFPPVEYKSNK
ncbi:39S ribosomal protein S18a, mitochondrial [Nymphon striatum]|nr:39S ribosomal protein S18a, mitochondrial [Nymphon striatum]